jgi:hypothetical protein
MKNSFSVSRLTFFFFLLFIEKEKKYGSCCKQNFNFGRGVHGKLKVSHTEKNTQREKELEMCYVIGIFIFLIIEQNVAKILATCVGGRGAESGDFQERTIRTGTLVFHFHRLPSSFFVPSISNSRK